MTYTVASIDIGQKNYAVCIETFDVLKNSDNFTHEQICAQGKITQWFLWNIRVSPSSSSSSLSSPLSPEKEKKKNPSKGMYKVQTASLAMRDMLENLTTFLDDHWVLWEKCDYIVIEQQMSFAKKHNTAAMKIAQHTHSYFIVKGLAQRLVEFPSSLKTQILYIEDEFPDLLSTRRKKVTLPDQQQQQVIKKKKSNNLTPTARKKWSVLKCKKILLLRNDTNNLTFLSGKKKADDIADTVTQLQAWKIINWSNLSQ